MPGTIAHIIYAQKFIAANQIQDHENAYLIGNLIPDIRYFGVLPREFTHIELNDQAQAWDKVTHLVLGEQNIELFRKGFLFHNFLDFWWADKYPISTTDWYQGTALKWHQDMQLFPLIKDIQSLKDLIKKASKQFGLKDVSP